MSLRDELLKAGLVSADKIKQLEANTRNQQHQHKKNRTLGAEEKARQAEAQRRADAEAARKREKDQRLNQKREAEKQRREQGARARQLIDGHRLNEAEAEDRYNFQDGRFVRSVRVTAAQRKALVRGQLGIAQGDRGEFDFALIPRETALKLAEIVPERVLLLYSESSGEEEDDWGDW